MATPGSILGKQCPRFWVGSTEVTLYHSNIERPDFNLPRLIEQEDVINAHREWEKVGTGNHAEFVVRVNLFDYADPAAKYEEIEQYEHTAITKLAPHKDKDALKDSTGGYVEFFITHVKPASIYQPFYYDIVWVTFKSKDPVDLSKGLETAITDDLDDAIADDLDEPMIVE